MVATTGFLQVGATGYWLKRSDGTGPYLLTPSGFVLAGDDIDYAEIIDKSVANTTYICEAPIGTVSSAAAWRVTKIVVSGSTTTTTYAGNTTPGLYGAFDQVADNRLTLTYA